MALSQAPTITDSVVQNFFIEALGGAQSPLTYLDRFPDSVYTKAFDSLLVRFLYALLGPVGVGLLRQQYLEARLEVEQAGLQTVSLDNLYSNAFGFARLANETYTIDANASLLPAAQRATILQQDANFRNRAIDFLKGARGGATLRGLSLVAKSGLNRPVELIENYRALFDHFSDIPLQLPTFGSTSSVAEVVVVPRQTLPQNAVQSIVLQGHPTQGWFTMTYPIGQLWMPIPVATTAGSATITVPDATRLPPGVFVTLTNLPTTATAAQIDPTQPSWNHATLYAQSRGGAGTSVTLVQPLSGVTPGAPATAVATGNFIAFVGVSQTTLLPFNATAAQVQNALTALPLVGAGNIVCGGGPLPDQPITVSFINNLSDQPVPTLQFNLAPDKATGVTAIGTTGAQQLADIVRNILYINGNVSVITAGVSLTSQATVIAPADEYALYAALNQTRPLTTLFTTQPGQSETVQQTAASSFQGSSQVNVIRYATGRAVQWPPLDSTHWIEPGTEHEAPVAYGVNSRYQGFHKIRNVMAYTEEALLDAAYLTSLEIQTAYWNSLIGTYSPWQLLLYPGLSAFNSGYPGLSQFTAIDCLAAQSEPLILSVLEAQGIINDVYPVDYMSVPGVPEPTGGLLWASLERATGVDYLEIDLGEVQAVNYLYFEATNKPYVIDVAYDILDQAPYRNFVPVTWAPDTVGPCTTNLNYEATRLWNPCTVNCTDALGKLIYTRFLRLGFTKTPGSTVYGPIGHDPIPYSIEVQNMRIGRYAY